MWCRNACDINLVDLLVSSEHVLHELWLLQLQLYLLKSLIKLRNAQEVLFIIEKSRKLLTISNKVVFSYIFDKLIDQEHFQLIVLLLFANHV